MTSISYLLLIYSSFIQASYLAKTAQERMKISAINVVLTIVVGFYNVPRLFFPYLMYTLIPYFYFKVYF